jgi:hypothetical protein
VLLEMLLTIRAAVVLAPFMAMAALAALVRQQPTLAVADWEEKAALVRLGMPQQAAAGRVLAWTAGRVLLPV